MTEPGGLRLAPSNAWPGALIPKLPSPTLASPSGGPSLVGSCHFEGPMGRPTVFFSHRAIVSVAVPRWHTQYEGRLLR
jgi:hypothetical protein